MFYSHFSITNVYCLINLSFYTATAIILYLSLCSGQQNITWISLQPTSWAWDFTPIFDGYHFSITECILFNQFIPSTNHSHLFVLLFVFRPTKENKEFFVSNKQSWWLYNCVWWLLYLQYRMYTVWSIYPPIKLQLLFCLISGKIMNWYF